MRQLLLLVFLLNGIVGAHSQVELREAYQWGNFSKPWSVTDFKINSSHYYENTVNVIPPSLNPDCPAGKLIVMTGQPRGFRRMIISDLFTNTQQLNTAKGTNLSLDIDSNFQKLATDNQIIRLKNGNLLAIKLGFLWEPITPKPFWGDWLMNDVSNYQKMSRDGIFIYRSTDCGTTWNLLSKIDATKICAGQYGVPKPADDDKDGLQDKDNKGTKIYRSNGFDRQEVYYDEGTNMIYLSTQVASGAYQRPDGIQMPAISKYAVFVSSDQGATWHLGKENIDKALLVMTTTVNGRFFMFSASGGSPKLFYTTKLKDFGLTSLKEVDLRYPKNGAKKEAEKDENIHQFTDMLNYSISRGPHNSVYVAYPVLKSNGRSEYIISHIKINESNPASFSTGNYKNYVIEASEPNLSMDYGTFIESRAESVFYLSGQNSSITPKSLFFYIESTSGAVPDASRKVSVKAFFLDHRTNKASHSFFVSKEKDNNDRWFKPYTAGGGIGHYTKGAYFIHADKQNYAIQWPEPDGIHVSIISGVEMWRKDDKEFLNTINERFQKSQLRMID